MNLWTTLDLYFGGPGSGCNPEVGTCGRPPGTGWAGPTLTKSAEHIPDVVPKAAPKKARVFVHDPSKVGGFFRPGSAAALMYQKLNEFPGAWHSIDDFKAVHGQNAIGALYTLKAAGIASGKWNIERSQNKIRLVVTKEADSPKAETDAIENSLLNSPIKTVRYLGGGVDDAEDVTLEDGTHAVLKLASKEPNNRDDITVGYGGERAVAAWKVAQLVGMQDMVEPAVIRNIRGDKGVLIKYADGKVADAFGPTEKFDGKDNWVRAAAFDYVIGNEDRHGYNWIVTPDKKLKLIDHGLAFPDKLRKDGEADSAVNSKFVRLAKQLNAKNEEDAPEPKSLAGPYVEQWPKIKSSLQQLGLPKGSLNLMDQRIQKLSQADKWNQLGGRKW